MQQSIRYDVKNKYFLEVLNETYFFKYFQQIYFQSISYEFLVAEQNSFKALDGSLIQMAKECFRQKEKNVLEKKKCFRKKKMFQAEKAIFHKSAAAAVLSLR